MFHPSGCCGCVGNIRRWSNRDRRHTVPCPQADAVPVAFAAATPWATRCIWSRRTCGVRRAAASDGRSPRGEDLNGAQSFHPDFFVLFSRMEKGKVRSPADRHPLLPTRSHPPRIACPADPITPSADRLPKVPRILRRRLAMVDPSRRGFCPPVGSQPASPLMRRAPRCGHRRF